MCSDAPKHPFRVTSSADRGGPPLTGRQKQVLGALDRLCPTSGSDCDARAVATATGLRLGGIVVILNSLVDKRLVTRFDEEDALFWTPTFDGRSRVRRFRKASTDTSAGPANKPAPGPA